MRRLVVAAILVLSAVVGCRVGRLTTAVPAASPSPIPAHALADPAIDPRAPWLSITRSTALPRFSAVSIAYGDEIESGGRINIYVTVTDEFGAPLSGVRVCQVWPDDRACQLTVAGATDFPQSGDSSFDPGRDEAGPYKIIIIDVSGATISDETGGYGLPLRRHVTYYPTFRRLLASSPSPTPTVTGSATPTVIVTPAPITPTPGTTDSAYLLHRFARALRAAADELDKEQ